MKIHIDRDGCIECGNCEATCAEVFVLPPGEKATVTEKYRKSTPADGEVGDNLVTCTTEAADSCPVSVINISQ